MGGYQPIQLGKLLMPDEQFFGIQSFGQHGEQQQRVQSEFDGFDMFEILVFESIPPIVEGRGIVAIGSSIIIIGIVGVSISTRVCTVVDAIASGIFVVIIAVGIFFAITSAGFVGRGAA